MASRFAITAAILIASTNIVRTQSAGPPSELPAALRRHVQAEQFTAVAKVGDLPPGVRNALQKLFGGKTLDLAEPGAPFQVTDVMVTPRLPARRLVSAGCSADHCLVYYERGGFAHVHYVVLLEPDGTTARVICGDVATGGLADLEQVKDELMAGKVLGGVKYW